MLVYAKYAPVYEKPVTIILTRLFHGNIVLVFAIIFQCAISADKICCFTRLWRMVFQNALQMIVVT